MSEAEHKVVEPKAAPVEVKDLTVVLARPELIPLLPVISLQVFAHKKNADLEQERKTWLETVNSSSCNNGQFQLWVLVRRDDQEAQAEPLSYAGTVRRKCLVRRPDGTVSEQAYYQWMPIMTPTKYQGNSYAKHMVRLIHYILADPSILAPFPTETWGPPPPLVSAPSRHPDLPLAVGTILTSGVPQIVYSRMSMTLASGTQRAFEFFEDHTNDQIVLNLSGQPGPSKDPKSSQAAEWTAESLRYGDLPKYEGYIARHAREAIAHPAKDEMNKTICYPLPSTRQIHFIDYRIRQVLAMTRGPLAADTIAGLRLIPSAAVGPDGILPPHQDGWPLCIATKSMPTEHTVLHASGIADTTAARLVVDRLCEDGTAQGATSILMLGRPAGDLLAEALVDRGASVRQIRDGRYGWPPIAFCFFGEGEVVWRGMELYAFP